LIQRHLPNRLTQLHRHLSKAGLEGVTAVIQWVKKTARGFLDCVPTPGAGLVQTSA